MLKWQGWEDEMIISVVLGSLAIFTIALLYYVAAKAQFYGRSF